MSARPSQKTIIHALLVEDSRAIAVQIGHFLSETSGTGWLETKFNLEHVTDLSSAVERVSNSGIDIVLLDLGLPDSEGLDTLLRIQETAPELPTIVFTGLDDEDIALRALKQGAQDYLVKGQVDSRLLRRSIRYAIQRKQAEETLRASEEKHRTLLEAMPDIIFKIDPAGRITYISQAIATLGFDPEELLGVHFSEIVHPDDLDKVSRDSVLPKFKGKTTGYSGAPKLFDERRTGDRITKNLVLRLVPNGWTETDESNYVLGSVTSYGELSATGQYLTDKKTNKTAFSGTVGIIKDITERRRMEQEREALEDQLRQLQKMEAIGRLAGGMAHDMNNVLMAILGSASALKTEIESNDDGKQDLDNIIGACLKGRDLTQDLLGFARKGKYQKQSIPLNEVVRETQALLGRTISKGISLTSDLEKNLGLVEGDRNQIHHALMNVCLNAADAMEQGGTLAIATKNVVLTTAHDPALSGLAPGRFVKVEVSDTGTGIERETLKKVFEPFYTTKAKGKGTGMGLPMVYGVIKNHGGSVDIVSEPGEGTRVTFLLPKSESTAEIIREKPAPDFRTRSDRGGILLVDDEYLVRQSVARLIEKLGYTVFLAESGRNALEIYQHKKTSIALVMLDLIMPEMDGPETFNALLALDPRARVLLFSGFSRDDKVEALLRKGARGFLQKPFDLDALSDSINSLLAD